MLIDSTRQHMRKSCSSRLAPNVSSSVVEKAGAVAEAFDFVLEIAYSGFVGCRFL
jgi:hypothetical protein